MRFGIFDHDDDSGIPAPQQLAQRLELIETYERLGFRTYHLAEHHGTPLSITPSPHLLLAAASQRTSRLRLGTLITVTPLYHPVRLIEEVCTLDNLTGGRLDLGVGRGSSPTETSYHEIAGEETPARFAETLEILRLGLTSDTLNYHGKFHHLDDVPMVLKPVQQPHPPLWFGVHSPERAIWAAQGGMHIVSLLSADRTMPITEAYRQEWASLGRAADQLLMGVNRHIVLADTDEEAMRVANRAFQRLRYNFEYVWHRAGLAVPPVLPGSTFEELHRKQIAYAGRPEGAIEFVERERELAGINYMAIDVAFGDMTQAEARRTAELFADKVMPAFADDPVAAA